MFVFTHFTTHTICKYEIAFLTSEKIDFLNLSYRMNCLTISQDTTLVAGGFSESFIKIWHLKGKLLQSKSEKEQGTTIFLKYIYLQQLMIKV